MKMILKNSELVFEKVTLVRKQVSYTVTPEQVGSKIVIKARLDDIPLAGTVLTITQSGDTVVADNNYTLSINGILGPLFNASKTYTAEEPVLEVSIDRSATTSAGTVILTVEYYKSNALPNILEGRLTLVQNVGELVLQLPEVKPTPACFVFNSTVISGMSDTAIRVRFYDDSDTLINTITGKTVSEVFEVIMKYSSYPNKNIKSIKIDRNEGSARNLVADFKVYYQ